MMAALDSDPQFRTCCCDCMHVKTACVLAAVLFVLIGGLSMWTDDNVDASFVIVLAVLYALMVVVAALAVLGVFCANRLLVVPFMLFQAFYVVWLSIVCILSIVYIVNAVRTASAKISADAQSGKLKPDKASVETKILYIKLSLHIIIMSLVIFLEFWIAKVVYRTYKFLKLQAQMKVH